MGEVVSLNKMIGKLKDEIATEIRLKEAAIEERNDVKKHMSHLEKQLTAQSTTEAEVKQRDTLLSTLRADLNSLTKIKDAVEKEKNMIEEDLTAENFELRNTISSLQMNADKEIVLRNRSLEKRASAEEKLFAELEKLRSYVKSSQASAEAATEKAVAEAQQEKEQALADANSAAQAKLIKLEEERAKALDEATSILSKQQALVESERAQKRALRKEAVEAERERQQSLKDFNE